MAEHDCLRRLLAVLSSGAQQFARLGIGQVKPAIVIEIPGEQLHVMITFNIDEIRVNEMFQQTAPTVEISRDDHLAALVRNHESIGRKQRIVRHFKRLKSEVANLEAAVGEWFQLERGESAPVEMLVFELRQTTLHGLSL